MFLELNNWQISLLFINEFCIMWCVWIGEVGAEESKSFNFLQDMRHLWVSFH